MDLGAGLGHYGMALLEKDSRHRYQGYDGAGNIEEFTDRMVRYADLSLPLSLDRADWVLSMETGEHIPLDKE